MKKLLLYLSAISTIGLAQVPAMLKDINVGPGMSMASSDMNNAYAYNNGLFFLSNDGTGQALWYSLGTTTTTKKIIPNTTGIQIAGVSGYTLFKNRVVFRDGTSNNIWITDGTNAGTYTISSLPGLVINTSFTVNANKIYFVGTTPANGEELYSTDTIIGSTSLVKDIWPGNPNGNPNNFLPDASGGFYFTANDGVAGDELWYTNGTTAGTHMVKDIYPGSGGSSSSPFAYTNNTLFFMANDGVNGSEIWRSDGTVAGTFLLISHTPGAGSTTLSKFTTYNSKLIYMISSSVTTVFQADGIIINCTNQTVPAVYSLQSSGGSPFFYEFNGDLFAFGIRPSTGIGPPSIDSVVLFKMTNTVSTFKALQSFSYQSGGTNPVFWGQMRFQETSLNKFIAEEYFTAATSAHTCIISDGTSVGSVQVYPANGYFPEKQLGIPIIPFISNQWIMPGVTFTGGIDCELQTIDYNTLAVAQVKNINPTTWFQSGPASWEQYETLNNKVYFIANDGNTGLEPWVTDGTAAGTNLLLDIYPGTTNGPDCTMEGGFSIKKAGNNLFFVANEGIHGKEPWVIFNGLSGIKENEISMATINAYPNPFKNELRVKYTLANGIEEAVIDLIEPATGKLLMKQSVNENKGVTKFHTENLSAGIYLISVQQKDCAPVFIKVVNTK